MLKPNHSYLVVNGIGSANKLIQSNSLGKPSRVIFEFKKNDITTLNCSFEPEQIYTGLNTQNTIFVRREHAIHNISNKWPHGSIFVCPRCNLETDMAGNI